MISCFFSTGGMHLATMLGMLSGMMQRLTEAEHFGGISAGALMASVCAVHGPIDAYDVLLKHSTDKLLKRNYKYFNTLLSFFFKDSLLDASLLEATLKEILPAQPLKANLHVGYTNKNTMEYTSIMFEKGKSYPNLYKHVLASMAIPLVLPSVKINDNEYVDGGLYHSIPIEAIQKVVQHSIQTKEPLDLIVMSSKPFDYKMQEKIKKHSIFQSAYDAYHMIDGQECISSHTDKKFLDSLLENAKLQHEHINFNFFYVTQEAHASWNNKIHMENYGEITKETIDDLVQLGKSIVQKTLKSNLKF